MVETLKFRKEYCKHGHLLAETRVVLSSGHTRCKLCCYARTKKIVDNARVSNPEQFRNKTKQYDLKRRFGITLEVYTDMLTAQNHKCKICKQEETKTKLVVDHDHTSGKIRGLLCQNCNRALGMIKDSTLILKNMIEYLEG